MIDLKVGTQETLLIDVKDSLGNVSDLTPTLPRYDVYEDSTDTQKITNQPAVVDPAKKMTAQCLVNTTGWTPGHFSLYLRFTSAPEAPRLGPFPFKVNP